MANEGAKAWLVRPERGVLAPVLCGPNHRVPAEPHSRWRGESFAELGQVSELPAPLQLRDLRDLVDSDLPEPSRMSRRHRLRPPASTSGLGRHRQGNEWIRTCGGTQSPAEPASCGKLVGWLVVGPVGGPGWSGDSSRRVQPPPKLLSPQVLTLMFCWWDPVHHWPGPAGTADQ